MKEIVHLNYFFKKIRMTKTMPAGILADNAKFKRFSKVRRTALPNLCDEDLEDARDDQQKMRRRVTRRPAVS